MARPLAYLIILAALCWAVVFIAFEIQGFNVFAYWDTWNYWQISQHLDAPFNEYHLPAYPVLIAIGEALLPFLTSQAVMQLLAFGLWLLAISNTYFVFCDLEVAFPGEGALLLGVFPLVGTVYSIVPIAESMTACLVTGAVLAYLRRQGGLFVLLLAIGIFTHKGIWVYSVFMIGAALWEQQFPRYQIILWVAGFMILPFLSYWLWGTLHEEDALWILRTSANVGSDQRGSLPLMEGLIGTLGSGLNGSLVDLAQAVVCWVVFLAALYLLWSRIWVQYPILLGFIAAVIIWGVFVTQLEVWVVVRFGRFLTLPGWIYLHQRRSHFFARWFLQPSPRYTIVGLALLSQIAFSAYVVSYWT